MMWALLFLKTYSKESVLVRMLGRTVDEKTWRESMWRMVDAIGALEPIVVSFFKPMIDDDKQLLLFSNNSIAAVLQIDWDNWHSGDFGNDCLVSVDGTDFQIFEHGRDFFSHKNKKSGLRYEVSLCILSGHLVWINGPFACSLWPDVTIFRDSLMSHLEQGECVEADDGYIGEAPMYVKCPKSFTNPEECTAMQRRVRSRQETVNARFKNWGCLSMRFRHAINKHGDVFWAVAVVTELSIQNGEALFDVKYDDDL